MYITAVILLITLVSAVLMAIGFTREGKAAEACAAAGLCAAVVHLGLTLAQASYGASPAGGIIRDALAWLALAEFAIAGILAIARIMRNT